MLMAYIVSDFIPMGRKNRPALFNPCEYITIHNTGNESKGANAMAHASYLKNTDEAVSWHYTADESGIVQHLPDCETAYHAGDGKGNGNRKSIGIEICVNGDLIKAHDNGAWLTAKLLKTHRLGLDKVVQHNKWTGKNCPQWLREGNPYTWEIFISKVRYYMSENETMVMTKDEAKAIVKEKAKLSDSTLQYILDDYRWGDELIIKLAQAMK